MYVLLASKRPRSLHHLELKRAIQREVKATLCRATSHPHSNPRRRGYSHPLPHRLRVAFQVGPPLSETLEFVIGLGLSGEQFDDSAGHGCCRYRHADLLRSPGWLEAASGLEPRTPAEL